MARILSTAQRAGKKCGVYSTSGEQAKAYADKGYDMICAATDITTLSAVLQATLNTARGGKEALAKSGSS